MWVAGLALAFLSSVAALILLGRLREYRQDLTRVDSVFEGRSRFWQVNVLRPSNYCRRGRRILLFYVASQLLQLIGIALLLRGLAMA
jgi:hypothetical protein